MKAEYLIIGNSVAGVSCIEGIREIDRKGKIIILSDEDVLNYSRPLISYYLGKKVTKEKMAFKEESFYKDNDVRLFLNTKAVKIDVAKREVYVEGGGERIVFEKLLISTGGKPIIPPIDGLEKAREGVFTFTKLKDAEKIAEYIEKNNIEEATVLGAGLIGLKCTEGLLERGLKVRIVELADRILANTLDKEASSMLEKALKEQGCSLIKNDTIVKINVEKGKVETIILKSGRRFSTRLLIVAIGVLPNVDLVKDTPIKYDRGILVNNIMQTNVENIYAAGDVAQGKDFLSEKNSVIAIWPVASSQGKIAGLNMAGKREEYKGLFAMNSVEIAGIPTISFGITSPLDGKDKNFEILSKKDEKKRVYRKIVLKRNKIVGAIFLGKIERAGIFAGLIKDRLDVSSFKNELLSEDFGFLVLPAEYRKHLVEGEGIEV